MESVNDDNCGPVFEKVEQWKKRLLDLTRRNRLLYLTEAKAKRSVEITSPDVAYLIDAIVDRGRPLTFPMSVVDGQVTLANTKQTEGTREEPPIRKGDLETNLPIIDLSRSLYRLRHEWLTWQEEQGIHTLFLATGLLKWKEASSPDEEFLAPIILVPVGLERKSLDEPYTLRFVEEDIVLNPALSFKLSADFGISLPELPHELDGASVEQYLAAADEIVKKLGWQVARRVSLGRFTYEKFVMYSDLTYHRDEACNHPVARALSKVPTTPQDSLNFPRDLDEILNPSEVFPILDADSSQIEVLLRARHRENLVVQGPPGTGKSQTIANLIAQELRDGKKVLFVSEKMAALEVVNRRLRSAGLSFACLEVHSHRSDKSQVVQELAKTLTAPTLISELDSSEQYAKLIRLRDRLNNYVRELHSVRGALKLSAFQVHGRLSKVMSAPNVEFKLPSSVTQTSLHQLEELLETVAGLQQLANVFDKLRSHPWYGIRIELSDQPQMLVVDTVVNLMNSLAASISTLQGQFQPLGGGAGLEPLNSLNMVEKSAKLARILAQPEPVVEGWLHMPESELSKLPQELSFFRSQWQARTNHVASLTRGFDSKVMELPVREVLDRFVNRYKTLFRTLKSDYRRDRASVARFWKSKGNPSYSAILEGLTAAVGILEADEWLQHNQGRAQVLIAEFYLGEATNWDALFHSLDWLLEIRQNIGQHDLPSKLAELMAHDPKTLSRLAQTYWDSITPTMAKAFETTNKLSKFLPNHMIDGKDLRDSPFSAMINWLESKKDPHDLQDWLRFQIQTEKCDALGLKSFLDSVIENKVAAKDLRDTLLQRFWKIWLSEAYRESPLLDQFHPTSHEEVIREFRKLEQDLKDATIQVVRQNIARKQPRASLSYAKDSQRAILLREAQKRRRIKPLRKLFEEIPQLIQELKPCLLMSPLSVASYLGTSPYHFDVVIFDEASQIPPADAIGSILRGTCLIVAGDNKQLPPTRFFQADIELDEDSEEGNLEEPLESILDECLALPGFNRSLLKWHYRSNSEELIDFSNKNFYDGELVTFPSPRPRDSEAAVELLYVNDGIYDRGGSRKNRQEAKMISDLIENHFRQYGSGTTLGVITLSIAQEEAVWEEWEQRKILKPDLAAMVDSSLDEPFFIKSLEKVQGDERDRIIISLGYGRDSQGVLSMNFGPINQSGGERRLNVAVTRARDHLVLVSSILPQEIDPTRLSKGGRGVGLLQRYLEYASNGGRLQTETYGGAEPESDFEYEVRERLIAQGLDVDPQVGCSDFRIDLAIRHPKHKNRYVLGVECDGATYHSQRSARDRDRLRQQILEKLGWKIHRVWSTDWVRNPERIVQEIIQRVQELSEDAGVEALVRIDTLPKGDDASDAPVKQDARSPPVEANQTTSVPANPYGFRTYDQFPARQMASRERFYYLAESRSGLRRLASEIQGIVKMESPVHRDAVARKLAGFYGIERVGSNVQLIAERATKLGISEKMFRAKGDFLWIDDLVVPRVPRPGDDPRPIDEVPLEEIGAALEIIVEKEIGISRDSLLKTTARVIGYDRSGARVEARIGEAIDNLFSSGRFSSYGEQITLKPPQK
jgi:very-short-patch-repair endonuclease